HRERYGHRLRRRARSERNRCRGAADRDGAGRRTVAGVAGGSLAGENRSPVERMIGGLRFVELATPVAASGGGPLIGYMRLGLSSDRQQQSLRNHLLGALTVVGLLVVIAVIATLLLTRRLVAPMRRLMRAARAGGSGRLDGYV